MATEDSLTEAITRLVYRILQHPGAPVARVMHGIFLNDNATDSNLCDVALQDGTHITGLPRMSGSLTSGDPVLIITGPAMPMIVMGTPSGNIQAINRVAVGEGGIDSGESPLVPPGTIVSKNYYMSAFGCYRGSTLYSNQIGSGYLSNNYLIRHGTSSGNSTYYYRSLLYFPYGTIQSDFADCTIQSCNLVFRFEDWYDGTGDARFGTHNLTTTVAPSTYPGSGTFTYGRITSTSWHDKSTRTVSLGPTIGGELADGTSTGLILGPGTSTSQKHWYGYADWLKFKPYLQIVGFTN